MRIHPHHLSKPRVPRLPLPLRHRPLGRIHLPRELGQLRKRCHRCSRRRIEPRRHIIPRRLLRQLPLPLLLLGLFWRVIRILLRLPHRPKTISSNLGRFLGHPNIAGRQLGAIGVVLKSPLVNPRYPIIRRVVRRVLLLLMLLLLLLGVLGVLGIGL